VGNRGVAERVCTPERVSAGAPALGTFNIAKAIKAFVEQGHKEVLDEVCSYAYSPAQNKVGAVCIIPHSVFYKLHPPILFCAGLQFRRRALQPKGHRCDPRVEWWGASFEAVGALTVTVNADVQQRSFSRLVWQQAAGVRWLDPSHPILS
jgi:hypothetical protein